MRRGAEESDANADDAEVETPAHLGAGARDAAVRIDAAAATGPTPTPKGKVRAEESEGGVVAGNESAGNGKAVQVDISSTPC